MIPKVIGRLDSITFTPEMGEQWADLLDNGADYRNIKLAPVYLKEYEQMLALCSITNADVSCISLRVEGRLMLNGLKWHVDGDHRHNDCKFFLVCSDEPTWFWTGSMIPSDNERKNIFIPKPFEIVEFYNTTYHRPPVMSVFHSLRYFVRIMTK